MTVGKTPKRANINRQQQAVKPAPIQLFLPKDHYSQS
jgi:hypothetical protein